MTLANDGFVSSPYSFILSTSPSSRPQSAMHPRISAHSWSWSPCCTPNRCTCTSNTHDSSTFDPSGIWTLPSANDPPPSTDHFKHFYPSPPPTDSDPKHTVPLPALCEDFSSHAAATPTCSHPYPLTHPCSPTPLTEAPEGPLTSHHPSQDLPPSPPPSPLMVPHPIISEDTTSCFTLDNHPDFCTDQDFDSDLPDSVSQSSSSSSSPDEPPPTDLLTPLSPILDLPLDDAGSRPTGTVETSMRSLLSPFTRHSPTGVQTAENDRITVSCGLTPPIRDLDPSVESQCGQLCSLVVSPDASPTRFSMFHTFLSSSPPSCDGIPLDGLLSHSQPSSGGKLFVDSPLDRQIPNILPHLTLIIRPLQLSRQISLPSLRPDSEEQATGARHGGSYGLLPPCHIAGALGAPFGPLQGANVTPVRFLGSELSATSNILPMTHNSSPSSPLLLLEPGRSSLGALTAMGSDSSDLGPMDVDDAKSPNDPFTDFGDLAASSPMRRTLPDLDYDVEDPFDGSPLPMSPSRRSFADLPEDTTAMELSRSPPQSPLFAGPPLLTLPGAEPDNSLIVSETPVSEWSAASPPRGSGLGLFLPIQAASSNQPESSETQAIEPNLSFSREAVARVNVSEFEKLKSVRRRTWVLERKAKDDEILHAKHAEHLADRLSVAPPVPSKLADFDERGGVSAGADADDTEGPPGEPAQLHESDEKTVRTWLLYTEARRAEARRVRKREKERGREIQALLRLKLKEDPDAMEQMGGARVKPGKTAIVSMPQLVARMIMKRRYTPRPFSPRKHDSPYVESPLSRFGLER
ncbi:hypothetical protein BGW80DRAFT_890683 [Lactifluus volemus]|nr:hypothetical protein BGW80DRAFT_890683 [Lactifluus volemus]